MRPPGPDQGDAENERVDDESPLSRPRRLLQLGAEQIAEGTEAAFLGELLAIVPMRATLFIFGVLLDAQLGLHASRVDVDHLDVEQGTLLELFAQIRAAQGSGLSGGDEAT